MAYMMISEYKGFAAGGQYPLLDGPPLRRMARVTTSTSAATSAAVGASTKVVEISLTADTHIRQRTGGATNAATTDDTLYAAGLTHHFPADPGDTFSAILPS